MMPATPVHHTATEDSTWDGPAAVAGMPGDEATLRYCHAWHETDADLDEKSAHKFPHHHTKGGPANLAAVRNGLARLSQADIPEGDRSGVEAHLRAHLEDAGGEDDDERATLRPGLRRLPAAVAERLGGKPLEDVTVVRGGRRVDARQVKAKLEVREGAGDAASKIVGYASVFEVPYSVFGGPEYGGWTETMAPGAFRRTLRERADVRLLLNHDGIPLARTRSGTMRLDDDQVGLFVDADLDLGSSTSRDVMVAMRRGDLDEMSFAFEIMSDEWSPDFMTRRITEVRLYDVSLVTYPASGAASAYLADDLKASDDEDEGEDERPEDEMEAASAAGRGMSLEFARAQRDRVLLGR